MIISAAELEGIANEFGPNTTEDVCRKISPSKPERVGAGWLMGEPKKGPLLGCRLIYVGNMNVRERQEAWQIVAEADYIFSLPAGTAVQTQDTFEILARVWQPGMKYTRGQKVVPSVENGMVYTCASGGTTGNTEPEWPTETNDTIDDGFVLWQNAGLYPVVEVIQLASPSTYGDLFSKRMSVTIKQQVTPDESPQ